MAVRVTCTLEWSLILSGMCTGWFLWDGAWVEPTHVCRGFYKCDVWKPTSFWLPPRRRLYLKSWLWWQSVDKVMFIKQINAFSFFAEEGARRCAITADIYSSFLFAFWRIECDWSKNFWKGLSIFNWKSFSEVFGTINQRLKGITFPGIWKRGSQLKLARCGFRRLNVAYSFCGSTAAVPFFYDERRHDPPEHGLVSDKTPAITQTKTFRIRQEWYISWCSSKYLGTVVPEVPVIG